MSGPHPLRTPRLDLVATTVEHLDAELDAPETLGARLAVGRSFVAASAPIVPSSWPPGVYDRGAMRYFRERLIEGGASAAGWYGWYVITRAEPATLIAAAGYFGPPVEGTVEIGYSVVPEHRSKGYAGELARALTEHALAMPDVTRVVAETHEQNVASRKVLERAGFRLVGAGRAPGDQRYERRRE